MRVFVELSSTNAANGYSNGEGIISGKIPANEQLALNVFDLCGGILHTESIGPFSDDIDLGDISVILAGDNFTNVAGTLQNCSNNLVTNGFVIFEFENKIIYEYINDSNFDLSFILCPNTDLVNVVTMDLNGLKQSSVFEVPAGISSNIGPVQICDNQLEYHIQLIIGDSTYNQILNWVGTNNERGTQIVALNPESHYFLIYFDGLSTGDYSTRNSVEYILSFDDAEYYSYYWACND